MTFHSDMRAEILADNPELKQLIDYIDESVRVAVLDYASNVDITMDSNLRDFIKQIIEEEQ